MENQPPKKLSHSAAWGCVMTNLLVLPGVGSMVATQRFAILQASMAVVGLVLMVLWLGWFIFSWIKAQHFPDSYGPYLWVGVLGTFLFIVSWVWSLFSSLQLLRQTKDQP